MDKNAIGEAIQSAMLNQAGLSRERLLSPRPVPKLNEGKLREAWRLSRTTLEIAMEAGEIPDSDLPYNPRVEAFRERLILQWDTLPDPDVFPNLFVELMKVGDDYASQLLSCMYLREALVARGEADLAALVAEREAQVIERERHGQKVHSSRHRPHESPQRAPSQSGDARPSARPFDPYADSASS